MADTLSALPEWLAAFRDLHERARRGQLHGAELAQYRAGRDDLTRVLLAAQRLQLRVGEVARRALRVTRALQLELELDGWRERTVTTDVSTGGFGCVLRQAPPLGAEPRFSLRLPAAAQIEGRARVRSVKPGAGGARAAFMFGDLDGADRERLETFVLDAVLALLAVR